MSSLAIPDNVPKCAAAPITNLKYEVKSFAHPSAYKTKKIMTPQPIFYSKDALAGKRQLSDEINRQVSLPVGPGSRIYIGKELNNDVYVAIKEVVCGHQTRSKNTRETVARSRTLIENLVTEYGFLYKVNSACGPRGLFQNTLGTRLLLVQNLMTGTASDTLDAIRPPGSDLAPRGAVLIMSMLAARHLTEIHKKNVLHFDIKPINLMFSKHQNRVEFIDYGLAADGPEATPRGVTMTYASNDQLRLEVCTKRHDLVSLGITFVELMTKLLIFHPNRRPYVGHQDYLMRANLGYFDPRRIAIDQIMGAVSSRHREFARLCEEMMDERTYSDLDTQTVYERLTVFLEKLADHEYRESVKSWKSIPDYVPRISSAIEELKARELLLLRAEEIPKKSEEKP